jgi:LCP family protein required for cell wall assembly
MTEEGAPTREWPEQPPLRSAPGSVLRGPARPRKSVSGRGHQPSWRLALAAVAGLVTVLLILVIGGYSYLDGKLTQKNALVPTANVSAGSNWLISGAPGNVTRHQGRSFHVGLSPDPNSDTIILLHLPANGNPPVLVSIPRDSYVPIPGHGMNKINAAYSLGGARLLVQTVQNITGLTINHYINIGYVGLVNAVNAVGGVTICLPHALHDQASGVHLKKGCDTVNGKQALAFVRITVDQGTHLKDLISVAFALRNPETTTVPIANANYFTPAGDAVQWNRPQALRLFHDLRTDRPVPKKLLTGSHFVA